MVEVAIIADTHIPSRAHRLPAWVVDTVAAADIVVHGGDFDSTGAFDRIEGLATRFVAVRGNTDPDLSLPDVAELAVEDTRFVITHGSGPLAGYTERVLETVRERDPAAVGVSAHTHEPHDETVEGTRLLNPGSATGATPADRATMLRCRVVGGSLDVAVLGGD